MTGVFLHFKVREFYNYVLKFVEFGVMSSYAYENSPIFKKKKRGHLSICWAWNKIWGYFSRFSGWIIQWMKYHRNSLLKKCTFLESNVLSLVISWFHIITSKQLEARVNIQAGVFLFKSPGEIQLFSSMGISQFKSFAYISYVYSKIV